MSILYVLFIIGYVFFMRWAVKSILKDIRYPETFFDRIDDKYLQNEVAINKILKDCK